jgi:hypothetical protein
MKLDGLSGAISTVSTPSGPRGLSIIFRMAEITSSTEMSLMHLRLKSQEFHSQHGARGTAE